MAISVRSVTLNNSGNNTKVTFDANRNASSVSALTLKTQNLGIGELTKPRIDNLGDVDEGAGPIEDGSTLVYDSTLQKYVVKKLETVGLLDGGTF
jgi:hypothetical protein